MTAKGEQRYPWTTADSLRAFKDEHGLTQIQLADVLQASRTSVARWLQKNRAPEHYLRHLPKATTAGPAVLTRGPPAPEPELFIFQGFVRSQADLATVTRIVEAMGGQIVGGVLVP